jgi:hypothetical protein
MYTLYTTPEHLSIILRGFLPDLQLDPNVQ